MADDLLARTARFAQFLRAAVAVKSRTVTEVQKYPEVLWLSEMPMEAAAVRSPLLRSGWADPDDVRWLVVQRVRIPDTPRPPDVCRPWLVDIRVDDPSTPPSLSTRIELDAMREALEAPPSAEAAEAWAAYVRDSWQPWAERANVAIGAKKVYDALFRIHRELQGQAEAFDLFVGVGLLHDRRDEAEAVRRHLVAFPAEIVLDADSGTLTLQPSADFERPRIEDDFLSVQDRAVVQRLEGTLGPELSELGPLIDRGVCGTVVRRIVHALTPHATYFDDTARQNARASEAVAAFAPAVILRPRAARSLDQLLASIEQSAASLPPNTLTTPWRRLIEDDDAWCTSTSSDDGAASRRANPVEEPCFPLPSNEDQSRIIRHASGTAGVVVQGPPGTGKSHTIANLIAHYLATGRRVLVTAEKAQALQVLKDKLPTDLQALCVSLLGGSGPSDKDLQRSVKGILLRRQETDDPAEYERRAASVEAALAREQERLGAHERLMHDARVAETVTLSPVTGYQGTRSAIARRLASEAASLGWIDDAIPPHAEPPACSNGFAWLAAYHASLDAEVRDALEKEWIPLPFAPEEAVATVEAVAAARAALEASSSPEHPVPSDLTLSEVEEAAAWLNALALLEPAARSGMAWIDALRNSVLQQDLLSWEVLHKEATAATAAVTDSVVEDTVPVTIGGGLTMVQARRDLGRLSSHYANGGRRRRLAFFKPAVVKATDWVETHVSLDGSPVVAPEDVALAARACRGWLAIEAAWKAWGEWASAPTGSPRQQQAALRQRLATLAALLKLAKEMPVPAATRRWLAAAGAIGATTASLQGACAWRRAELNLLAVRKTRDELIERLPTASSRQVPALGRLVDRLRNQDARGVQDALAEHTGEKTNRERHASYAEFVTAVRGSAPGLAAFIQESEGSALMQERFLVFEEAWRHRCAATWLRAVLSNERTEAADRAARDGRAQIQGLWAELTAARAWHHALRRIDDQQRAALLGWTTAVANIPKTGRSVFRKRAVARQYLGRCLSSIPAWIVPLSRLYETVSPVPGLFDIAIIDEASQCSLDSLVLFYLAKQIIVVGDDKQISPTVVGIRDGEVEGLAGAYLQDLRHRGLFTLESSLFDHAARYLPGSIQLREHFRCVPEIIRFSNELCYADTPLIPLRPTGRDRLEPLRPIFVHNGLRKGDVNDAEAQAIVDAIVWCHQDPAYEDLEFGVISLQGHDQASRIQHLLLERLGPSIFEERRLRCGEPYAFQGDERDVMFISMVAAPNANNAVLTKRLFEQRFNVAMSRAKDQAWLFHSVREHDLSAQCLRRRVLDFFYQPTDQLIRGAAVDVPELRRIAHRAERGVERPPHPFDSWFEVDVALAMAARGYQLSAQVQVAKRRIDLVVEGEGVRLAVECDGEAWHGPEQFSRDLDRQRQLERAGWRFARVREALFCSDPDQAIAEVIAVCDELEIVPGAGADHVSRATGPLGEPSPGIDRDVTPAVAEDSVRGLPERPVPDFGEEGERDREVAAEQRTDEEDVRIREVFTEAPRTGPFSGYDTREYPDPRLASSANVRDAVMDIVSRDGPLPKGAIYCLYRDGCPNVQRAGKNLKQAVNRAVAMLERLGKVRSRDEGGEKDPHDVVVWAVGGQPVAMRPLGARRLVDVPLSELASRMGAVQGDAPTTRTDRERLYRHVLKDLGLGSLTQVAYERLEKAGRMAFGTLLPS